MKKVCVFLADGFEEVEGLTVVDLLRRADLDVKMVSIKDDLLVTSARNITVKADILFDDIEYNDVDMLVLPGGLGGTEQLGVHQQLKQLITEFEQQGKYISAICAAPTILGKMGLLKGRKAVCYPGQDIHLIGAEVTDNDVEVSDHIITSKALGTAISFSLVLIEKLISPEKAKEIKDAIVYA